MIPTRKTDRAIGNISRTYPPGPNQMVLARGKSVRALRSNKKPHIMLKPFSKNQSRDIQSHHHLHHGNTGKFPTRKDRIGQGKREKKREITEANSYR